MEILPLKIDDDVQDFTKRLETTKFTGIGGGGLVKVTMSFMFEVENVTVAPELLADVELLEDLIRNAFNDAVANIKTAHVEAVQRIHQSSSINNVLPSKGDNDACDCTVCEERESCHIRPIKESLRSMVEALVAD